MGKPIRENNFGALRIMAAFMVLSGHMAYFIGVSPPSFLGQEIHRLGVTILFLIAGYLITQSWISDPAPLRYTIKRFFRIWPPLAVFLFIATFLIGPFLSYLTWKEYYTHPQTLTYLQNSFFYIQYVLPGVFSENPYPNAVNGSLWTLPVEVVMYILIPIFVSICRVKKDGTKRKSYYGLLIIAILFCAMDLLVRIFAPTARLVVYATDWVAALKLIPYYLIGMAFANPDLKKWLNLPFACFLILFVTSFHFSEIKMAFLSYFILPYFIFSIALAPTTFFSRFFAKYEISYGLYLYGFFIQQLIVYLTQKYQISFSLTVYTIICTLITIIVSLFSYRYVEQPCLALSKKILLSFGKKT